MLRPWWRRASRSWSSRGGTCSAARGQISAARARLGVVRSISWGLECALHVMPAGWCLRNVLRYHQPMQVKRSVGEHELVATLC